MFHYQSSERFLRIVYIFGDYPSISVQLSVSIGASTRLHDDAVRLQAIQCAE